MQECNKIAVWIKGYLDAIYDSEEISKKQLQNLIDKTQNLLDEVEKDKTEEYSVFEQDDESALPF